jgi:hypothetical protein
MDEQLLEDIIDIDKCLLEAEEAFSSKDKKTGEAKIRQARQIIRELKNRNDLGDPDVNELRELTKHRKTDYPDN